MLKKSLLYFCLLAGIFLIRAQEIEISGNGIFVPGDGSNSPNAPDGTLFANTVVNESMPHVFSIYNTDDKNITIDQISSSSGQFIVNTKIKNIKKNRVASFELYFEPTSAGEKDAVISILAHQGKSRKTYLFNVSGKGLEGGTYRGLMLSQYYENAENDFIEIANLSEINLPQKKYVLALFGPDDDLSKAPRKGNTIDLRKIAPGEVKVFNKFALNGDELLVISTSKGKNCYQDRIDVIGQQGDLWGRNISLSKGACATEAAHIDFDVENWISLSLGEVDAALLGQNIFLGTYNQGPVIWNGRNWEGGTLPDRTSTVIIDGDYSGNTAGIEACDLIVNDNLDFDNGGKNSVVVHRDLTIAGSFQLGDQESLVMWDDNAVVNGVISKIERSTFRNTIYDFTYWSSPVTEVSIGEVFAGVNPNRIYYFDQEKTSTSDVNHPDFWTTWVHASGSMVEGKGYAAEGILGTTGVHEVVFNGRPNNGVILSDVYHHDDTDLNNDYNLIGNPYPSAIDIELFFDANLEVIDPTIYLWTHTTPVSESSGDFSFDDYATYNYTGGTGVGNGPAPVKNIGSAQGFFVRAIAKGRVEFNNSMRLTDLNDQFFKGQMVKKNHLSEEMDRIWLNLKTDHGGFNQLLIGFLEEATDDLDRGYDALKFDGSNKISFYSMINNRKMAIQGLGPFEQEKEVMLGFDTKVSDRTYSIEVAKIEGNLRGADLILTDHVLGVQHDLKASSYHFKERNQGSFKDRFSLSFTRQTVPEVGEMAPSGQFEVFNEGDLFRIRSFKSVETIQFFNILGKKVLEAHPGKRSFEIREPLSKRGELLLLNICHTDQSRTFKKIYKQ